MSTRCRGGFTTQEPWIVIVILGILIAIAIPSFLKARQDATRTMMRGDLVALARAQTEYRRAYGRYAGSVGSAAADRLDFTPHRNVELRITAADSSGFAAIATSPILAKSQGARQCGIVLGTVARPAHVTRTGIPVCW